MYKWYHVINRRFTIFLGGIIVMIFGLCEHNSITSGGLSPVRVDFSGGSSGDAVNFGYLPHISGDDVTSFSTSFWLNQRSGSLGFQTVWSTHSIGQGNMYVITGGNPTGTGRLFLQPFKFSEDAGAWYIADGSFNLNQKVHIVITYEIDQFKDPVFYLNGVSQPVVEYQTPSGTFVSSVGTDFVVGNIGGSYGNSIDGILQDVRFYKNKILTQAEVTQLYNGGVVDTSLVTEGLSFQAFAINSDLGDALSLDGQQIPTGNKFLDNILKIAGEPHGTPLIRP